LPRSGSHGGGGGGGGALQSGDGGKAGRLGGARCRVGGVVLECDRRSAAATHGGGGGSLAIGIALWAEFPALIEANERISALDRQIHEEQARIIEGLRSEARAATAQAASLRGQLGALKGEIAANNSAAVKAESLQRNADAATGAYNHLASSVQQRRRSSRPASLRRACWSRPWSAPRLLPQPPRLAATSVLAGLVLGIIAAMVTETMQGTVRNADDVEVLLGLRFLASVPRLGRKQLSGEDGVRCSPADTLLLRPMSAYAEAYRRSAARSAGLMGECARRGAVLHRAG
jgi:hypothetical protein